MALAMWSKSLPEGVHVSSGSVVERNAIPRAASFAVDTIGATAESIVDLMKRRRRT
ncbi:MAG: hypothetical protein ACREJ3_04610 [Polyangiaceae bacterium]